nr:uncharacterized protein LOC119169115 isoform X2 [Rhipicephalus microplus]XP_037277982.1 uncharacterized protein LOC119170823 isoform X2 [Rhipicephalus microplus]XP_037278606.1 uncharacterized protein LOC119171849 isoform X2 [Rhipicephalus microplus]XP_037288065.1 uncharacterized protein LOC119181015 isoform X2 [Rhipicephalus microplus]XP_037290640.1 uncharacterized protein LOC119185916 isoform X2 [Rhipicephalus microplus]
MYAVVRFLDDHDKRLHVIHVHDIEKFDPKDTSDYDNRFVYSAYWRDPVDDTNTGLYNTQVLMLAESEDDARAKMRAKRLVIPKIPMQETTSDDDPDELVESQTKRKKAERKKQKNDRANAKKNMYDEILKKNLEKAHSGRKPRAQPRKGTDTPSDSGSSDSDELCPKSEILQMKKKKDVWKARTKALVVKELEKDRDMWKLRAEELQHDNQFLKQQVASLQRSLESKLFKLAVEQDRVPCSRGMLSAHSETDEGESFVGNLLIMDNMACSERVLPPCSSTAVEPEERTSTVGGEKNTTHPGPNGDFIYMEDGSKHSSTGDSRKTSTLLTRKKICPGSWLRRSKIS